MASMADPLGRDFLFCKFCGTMLGMESKHVVCPLCKFMKNVQDVADREISYTVTAEPQEDKGGSHMSKTRSADEGQTTYYICPRCGYRCQES